MQATEWRAAEESGEQQRWHPNGKTMWRGWVKAGRRQGHWAGFFANGTKAWTGQFKEGLAVMLGREPAEKEVSQALEDLNMSPQETRPTQLRRLRERIERNLSGLIGPQMAYMIINQRLELDVGESSPNAPSEGSYPQRSCRTLSKVDEDRAGKDDQALEYGSIESEVVRKDLLLGFLEAFFQGSLDPIEQPVSVFLWPE